MTEQHSTMSQAPIAFRSFRSLPAIDGSYGGNWVAQPVSQANGVSNGGTLYSASNEPNSGGLEVLLSASTPQATNPNHHLRASPL